MPIDRRDFLKMLGAASAISAAFPGLHADPVEGLRVVEAERSRRDPVALMRAATGFEPDPWQVRLLRSGAERMLVNCHRQAGKSTATSALAIHTAIARPDSLVLIISAAQRQAGELFRKVVDAYEALDKPIPAVEDNAVTLALENGSRIVSLPSSETTIRGYSAPRLVIVDEAARVMDAVFTALMPMLAISRGRLVELSTPMGKRGHFWRAWTEGGDDWERVALRGEDNPRIPPEVLATYRRGMIAWEFRQEFECSFEDTTDQVFAGDLIAGAYCSPEDLYFTAEE
jgi:hypothetical protein